MSPLVLVGLLGAFADVPSAPLKAAASPASAAANAPVSKANVRATTATAEVPAGEVPPPSAWDLQQRQSAAGAEDGPTLAGQLARTVLSLLFVVALIYLVAKLGLPHLARFRVGSGGAELKIVERLQLDPRHALFVVVLSGKRRFLLGTGSDRGVTLLAELEPAPEDAPGRSTFASVLADVRADDARSDRGDEGPR